MNSAISGYSVKCSFFSAAPLGTALAEYQYSPSAVTSSAKKSKHPGIDSCLTAGNSFACHYAAQTTNTSYATGGNVSFRISQAKQYHFHTGISAKEAGQISHGIIRCIPAGKFY